MKTMVVVQETADADVTPFFGLLSCFASAVMAMAVVTAVATVSAAIAAVF